MRQKSMPGKEPATHIVKTMRRAARRHFLAKDEIRNVLEGYAVVSPSAATARAIVQNLHCRWLGTPPVSDWRTRRSATGSPS